MLHWWVNRLLNLHRVWGMRVTVHDLRRNKVTLGCLYSLRCTAELFVTVAGTQLTNSTFQICPGLNALPKCPHW